MKLPEPPIVGQLVARLPDGRLDPDGTTDCGEACVASAVNALRKLPLSPGCIRQAMSLPHDSGVTTALDLSEVLAKLGIHAEYVQFGPYTLRDQLRRLRHYGRYLILLGEWVSPQVGHWVLAYQSEARGAWCMEPWNAQYIWYPWQHIALSSWDSQVVVSG